MKKFNSKILFKTEFVPVFNSIKYSFNTKKEYLPGLFRAASFIHAPEIGTGNR